MGSQWAHVPKRYDKMKGIKGRQVSMKVKYRFPYFTFRAKSKIRIGQSRNRLFVFHDYLHRF